MGQVTSLHKREIPCDLGDNSGIQGADEVIAALIQGLKEAQRVL